MPPSRPDPASWRRSSATPGRPSPGPRWKIGLIILLASFVALVGVGLGLSGSGDEKAGGDPSGTSPPASPSPSVPSAEETVGTPAETAPSDTRVGTPAETAPPADDEATVVRIVDGDTLDVRGDGGVLPAGEVVRVRLLAIDAPEKGDCFARQATARLRVLLPPGSEVRYERDVDLLDRYDRYLLYLWNGRGVFVNASLVRSGHAEARLYPPNDARWSEISRDGAAAEKGHAGLWGACPTPEPEKTEPRKPAQKKPAPDKSPPKPQPLVPEVPKQNNPAGLPPGPPAGVPDVDCSDLSGPVWVGSADPHRLDRDGDGIGCDSG